MKHDLAAILFGVALLGAAAPAWADSLPVPPLPPEHPPTDEGAPVPDPQMHGPLATAATKPSVDVRLYRARTYDPSMGFVPGSRYQSSEDRKSIQTPGLSITVPLD